MPPTVPINHYFSPRNQQNKTKVLFHYSMLMYSSETACFEHSNFFKVNVSNVKKFLRPSKGQRPPSRNSDVSPASSKQPHQSLSRPGFPTFGLKNRTPKFNYELFNCNNFNIRYWSWNYRGCWHQTCPPIDPR